MFFEEFDFKGNLGKTITLRGKVSNQIWQHMISPNEDFPCVNYFGVVDDNDEEEYQFVAYSKRPLPEDEIFELQGKLILLEGETKQPAKERRKYYSEYQIIVENVNPAWIVASYSLIRVGDRNGL